jgi:hypothetical protein
MAIFTKEEGMPPDKRSADREIIYGTAYRVDARARRFAN